MRVTAPTGAGCVVHLFVVCGIRGRRRIQKSFPLLTSCRMRFLMRLNWSVLGSLSLLLGTSMLILELFLALPRALVPDLALAYLVG